MKPISNCVDRCLSTPVLKKIPIRLTNFQRNQNVKKREGTYHNLVKISKTLSNPVPTRVIQLPKFFLSNVRAITNKIDELDVVLKTNDVDLAGITETWLNLNVPESCVHIQGYNLVRNDRVEKRGGGVCVFIKSCIPFVTLPNLDCPNHECLWIKLRPYRLPREISCILVCVVYHPPHADGNELYEYMIASLDKILSQFPRAGVIVMGDFNQFDTKRLCRNSSLKQIVKKPTRGKATLDMILTNMKHWYEEPEIFPAIGQSDHMSIMLHPLDQSCRINTKTKVWIRKRNPSNMQAFGRFLSNLDWSILSQLPSCQSMCDLFYDIINVGLNTIIPPKSVKLHCRDKAWITPEIKSLISQRQKALSSRNKTEYNKLRNKIIRVIKQAKSLFYESQVHQLKNSKPRKWWSAIKNLAGSSPKVAFNSAEVDGNILQGKALASAVNNAFIDITKSLPPLSEYDKLPIEEPGDPFTISDIAIEARLRKIKSNKAHGPDGLPNWILNSFSMELSEPVSIIFNTSIKQAQVPMQWKRANVIPAPKSTPVTNISTDLRPISLTATLSKTLESFQFQRIMDAIRPMLDQRQFGSLKGCSTVDALISMFHCWFSDTDSGGETVRVFLLDFSKAFDRINHQILIKKMRLLGIDDSILNWVIDFLMQRKQRVKLGPILSDWKLVNSGVPQGTILGPLLFLIMVNDLAITHENRWKYVDDTSLSETIKKGKENHLQTVIDDIEKWCVENDMVLNHNKCKELIISFAKETPDFPPLLIGDHCISRVPSAKVLGLLLSSDLRWNLHIEYVVAKASKRLYFLRVLKRSGVNESSLIQVFFTCIRPVLEYSCQVWNFGAPDYLKEEIERIQKRALRLIFPDLSYREVLEYKGIQSLSQRRNDICMSYFKKLFHPEHKLHDLVPDRRMNSVKYSIRNEHHVNLIDCKTSRFSNSFLPSSIVAYNDSLK